MTRSQKIKFITFRTIGNFLILFAIFGVLATFGPVLYYEAQYKIIQARGVEFKVADESSAFASLIEQQKAEANASFGDLLTGSKEQTLYPPDKDFSIVIPKIGASSKVIPNVNPADESDFLPALLEGVAHAQGTVFPGQQGNVYLFAHSADNFWDAGRYNAIFYLLKDLNKGDEIVLLYQGQRINYFVTDTKIVDPEDVSYITNAKEGAEQLILQTCWPPGTTFKRLLVFARPRKTDQIFNIEE